MVLETCSTRWLALQVFTKVLTQEFAKVIGRVFNEGGTVGNLRW